MSMFTNSSSQRDTRPLPVQLIAAPKPTYYINIYNYTKHLYPYNSTTSHETHISQPRKSTIPNYIMCPTLNQDTFSHPIANTDFTPKQNGNNTGTKVNYMMPNNLEEETLNSVSTGNTIKSSMAATEIPNPNDEDESASNTTTTEDQVKMAKQSKSWLHRRRRLYFKSRKVPSNPTQDHLVIINESNTSPNEAVVEAWKRFFSKPPVRIKSRAPSALSIPNSSNNLPYGDPMIAKPRSTYRFISQNVNGISYDAEGGDFQEICYILQEIEADVICFQETKLETRNMKVKNMLNKTLMQRWSTSKALITSTSNVNLGSIYKPGGTLLMNVGPISHRVTQTTADPLGRWCTMDIALKNKLTLTVISAYQVCQSTGSLGLSTAYSQQLQMLRTKHNFKLPREQFVIDITDLLSKLK